MQQSRPPQSFQDLVRGRQAESFIGRGEHVKDFAVNLEVGTDDPNRYALFAIDGQAGVGKSHLARRFCSIAADFHCLFALSDDESDDVLRLLESLVSQLEREESGSFRDFKKTLAHYWSRRGSLQEDPAAPEGLGAVLTNATTRLAVTAAKATPHIKDLLEGIEPSAAAEQVEAVRSYLAQRVRRASDIELILNPIPILTAKFLAGLRNCAYSYSNVVIVIDTFEKRGRQTEDWLLAVLFDKHGLVPPNTILVLAGQQPLDLNRWAPFLSVTRRIPLQQFSRSEVDELLAAHGIADASITEAVMRMTGGLPVLAAMLAHDQPQKAEDIEDPAETAVERFLQHETDEHRRNLILTASASRAFNKSVLAAIYSDDTAESALAFLITLPFVRRSANTWHFHELVRTLMQRYAHDRYPEEYTRAHSRLAIYHTDRLGESIERPNFTYKDPVIRFDQAESYYHLLCFDPDDASLALGACITAIGRNAIQARELCQVLIDAGNDSAKDDLRILGAKLLRDAEPQPEARERFYGTLIEAAEMLAPDDRAHVLSERGSLRIFTLRRPEEGIADCTASLELAETAEALAVRAHAQLQLGQTDQASHDISSALQLNPHYAFAHSVHYRLLMRLGDLDGAERAVRTALEMNPASPLHREQLADLQVERGQFDEAMKEYSRALESGHPNRIMLRGRANLLRFGGRYEEALADFDALARLGEISDEDRLRRGEILRILGRPEEAVKDMSAAARTGGMFGWATFAYGLVLRDLGQHDAARAKIDEAIGHGMRAILNDPTNEAALFNTSMFLAAGGRRQQADDLLRRLTALKWSATRKLQAARLLRELQESGLAVEIDLANYDLV